MTCMAMLLGALRWRLSVSDTFYLFSVAGGKGSRPTVVTDVIKQERGKEPQFNVATPQVYSK